MILDHKKNVWTRSKKNTHLKIKDKEYCSKFYLKRGKYERDKAYYVKFDKGTGGLGSKIIKKRNDFNTDIAPRDKVVCESLPGDEITIDCYSNEESDLMYHYSRIRSKVRTGTTFLSMELNDEKEKNF